MTDSNSYLRFFKDRRILIVEDEYFLADETRTKLQQLGAVVVGPTGDVAHALELIGDEPVDAAILDVYLDGEMVFPVAEKLQQLGIPYVFATGYDPSIIPEQFTGFVLSAKPIALDHIARALFGPPVSHD
ncbi:MAG: response regulator [Shinella sp.]|nr:response regulator [Shinella sp.]